MVGQAIKLITFLIFSWAISFGTYLAKEGVVEAELKSVFIINILNYVEWPKEKQSAIQNLCVYSDNPFSDFLENFAKLSTVRRNKPVKIFYPENLDELGRCHVIFISRKSIGELDKILHIAEQYSVLTISDINNFAEKKGMIELVSKKDLIKLHINYSSTKAAQLSMSYLLLELAEKVIRDELAKAHD